MDGGEAGAAKEAGHPVQDASERQAGSRPREEDADAIYQKLARTLQDQPARHVAPITCCGGHSTAASTAPMAYTWAKIRVTRRKQVAAKKGALPGTHIPVQDQDKIFQDLAATLGVSVPASEPEAPAADSAGGRSQDAQVPSSPQPDLDAMQEDFSSARSQSPDDVGTGPSLDWHSLVEDIQHSGSWDRLSGAFAVSVDEGKETVLFYPEREVEAVFSDAGVPGSKYVHDWQRAVARGYLLGFRREGGVVYPWCLCCGDWATQESLLRHRGAGSIAPCEAELCPHLSWVMTQGRQLIQSQIGECDVTDADVHELLLGVKPGWQLLDLSGVKQSMAFSAEPSFFSESSEAARFWSQPFPGGDLFGANAPRVGESYLQCTGIVLSTTKAVRCLTCKGTANLCGHVTVVRAALNLPRQSSKFCTDEYYQNHLRKVLDDDQENMRLRCRSWRGRPPDHGPKGIAASLHDDADEPSSLADGAKCLRGRSPSSPAHFFFSFH